MDVGDGIIAEYRAGDTYTDIGLGLGCWDVRDAPGPDGVVRREGTDPDGFATAHYDVSGVVDWVREDVYPEVVLRFGDQEILAQGEALRGMLFGSGSRVCAHGALRVVGDYEWEAFGIPDLRRDWLIRRIRLQHRALPLRAGLGHGPADVVKLVDVDHIDRAASYAPGVQLSYLLDLTPP